MRNCSTANEEDYSLWRTKSEVKTIIHRLEYERNCSCNSRNMIKMNVILLKLKLKQKTEASN